MNKDFMGKVEKYLNKNYHEPLWKSYPFGENLSVNEEKKEENREEYQSTTILSPMFGVLPKENRSSFSDVLKDLCRKKKIDSEGLCRITGLSKEDISALLKGEKLPKKETVFSLAIALHLSFQKTEALLMKMDSSFDTSDKRDVIVQYFLKTHNYDQELLEETLSYFGEPSFTGKENA